MSKFLKKNCMKVTISLLLVIVVLCGILFYCKFSKNVNIPEKLTRDKYYSLVSVLGKPNYLEIDARNNMKSATWMSPLDNFNDFGKYGGADYIKIHGKPSKKYHPHPANVFLILGKYIHVPEHLFGPLKYASETINIEQLFVPQKYSDKYYNTGIKDVALLTGSCASVTISAITVQFAMDMIEKYKGDTGKSLELYDTFRKEYDRRIDDFLCGKGITDPIEWFSYEYFKEGKTAFLGESICGPKPVLENFTHYPECEEEMGGLSVDEFCKPPREHKCC